MVRFTAATKLSECHAEVVGKFWIVKNPADTYSHYLFIIVFFLSYFLFQFFA